MIENTLPLITDENKFKLNETKNSLFQSLRKFSWLFVIIFFCCAIVGFFYANSKNPVFQSHLTFAINESTGGEMNAAMGLAAQFGLNMGGGAQNVFTGDNIIEILKCRRVLEKVLLSTDTFDNKPYTLIEYYLNNAGFRESTKNRALSEIHFPVGKSKADLSYLQDSVLYIIFNEFVQNFVSAKKPDKKLDIYEIKIENPNEKFTKIFTDRLIQETNTFYTEISSKKAKETLDILEDRVEKMKGNLNSTLSNKAALQDANLNPSFATAEVPIMKNQINAQVYSAAYGEMFKNLEFARFQYLKSVPLLQIIDAADYPMKRIKSSRLKYAFVFGIVGLVASLIIIPFFLLLLRKQKYKTENYE